MIKPPEQDYPIEEVVWEDHYSSDAWTSKKDVIEDNESIFITSIGYRLKETRQKIVLAQNLGSNGYVAGTITILKKTVAKRTIVREVQ